MACMSRIAKATGPLDPGSKTRRMTATATPRTATTRGMLLSGDRGILDRNCRPVYRVRCVLPAAYDLCLSAPGRALVSRSNVAAERAVSVSGHNSSTRPDGERMLPDEPVPGDGAIAGVVSAGGSLFVFPASIGFIASLSRLSAGAGGAVSAFVRCLSKPHNRRDGFGAMLDRRRKYSGRRCARTGPRLTPLNGAVAIHGGCRSHPDSSPRRTATEGFFRSSSSTRIWSV